MGELSTYTRSLFKNIMPDDRQRVLLWCLVTALLGNGLYVLVQSLGMVVVYEHPLRQYENGVTVYWLLQGGEWIFYETPVLGYPWKFAFEFPFYQWVVALLVLITDMELAAAARIVSYVMYLLVLWPAYLIADSLRRSDHLFLIFACLYLASPIYLFWGRAMMIDSTALFLALMWLAVFIRNTEEQTVFTLATLAVVTPLAVLVKITTLFGICLFAIFYSLVFLIERDRYRDVFQLRNIFNFRINVFLIPGLIFLASLWLFSLWVFYTDMEKMGSPIAAMHVSDNLTTHIYGTWQKRLDIFPDIILSRSIPNTLGLSLLLMGTLLVHEIYKRGELVEWRGIFILILLYLIPFYVFTNLHWRHDYHQYANAIFLLSVASLILWSVFRRSSLLGMSSLCVCCVLMVYQFYTEYYPSIERTPPKWANEAVRIGKYIDKNTPQDSGILVIGTNINPIIPYFGKRKAVLTPFFPSHLSNKEFERLTMQPQSFFGDVELSAIVMCEKNSVAMKEWTPTELRQIQRMKDTVLNTAREKVFRLCSVYLKPFAFEAQTRSGMQ